MKTCTSVIQFEDRNHYKQVCGIELVELNGAHVCPVCDRLPNKNYSPVI